VYLFVILNALFLDVVFKHDEIAILTNGIHVVAVCPKLFTPQKDFHLWMSFKHESCGNAFDSFDHS